MLFCLLLSGLVPLCWLTSFCSVVVVNIIVVVVVVIVVYLAFLPSFLFFSFSLSVIQLSSFSSA